MKRLFRSAKPALLPVLLISCLLLLNACSAQVRAKKTEMILGLNGIVTVDLSDQEAMMFYHVEKPGVYVLAVADGSEAQLGGICSGDRVVSAAGEEVETSAGLLEIVNQIPAGELFLLITEKADGNEACEISLTSCAE